MAEKTIVYGDVQQAEEVCCEICDTPIPPKRLALVGKAICVHCMEELEKNGRGTVRHVMAQVYHTKNGEEIEEVETFIVRAE